ncbi:UbiH/UbiF family hydroxylase [Paralimibaculum aggregatum]|uniref:UbiH/UbiF family hydroxylase n=1 Tax=Paralimibaculum aggregatum TaxID=3036245 RepID=A0ABQ6LFD5_9RHOB|nr:FAD-dependent monooxygenase [Limibaculum sp. NKW23]GMG81101.1 UbiH/UbiF family hydroxylase [Limibaculum sp. NKW23]
MAIRETDILIAGAGLAGLAAAARLGTAGQRVTLVDPAPETAGTRSDGREDLRTTAYLAPGIETLRRAGAWEAMARDAAPLRVMRLVDAGGALRQPRRTADFAASELQDAAFGQNIANTTARAALRARIAALGTVTMLPGTAVTGWLPRSDAAILRLSDGSRIAARLAIAADGRDSRLRRLAGLRARRWSYGQRALVFAVTHDPGHAGISTEIHRHGGPLTLVPMPMRAGRPSSAVVWMMPGARAERLMALGDTALAAELTAETMGLFGTLEIAGPRAAWPIIAQIAPQITERRLALIGEAAHVVPPIGAQGLNMSLADIECLAGIAAGAADVGAADILGRYARRRLPEIAARVLGVDLLNRFAQAEPQPLRDLRMAGLGAIAGIGPLRRLAMRAGLGATG